MLVEQFRARVNRADLPALRFAALDFAQATGLDSTGLLSFSKMLHLAREQGITMVLTGLRDGVRTRFVMGGLGNQAGVRLFPDLDRGVEWCESQIIAAQRAGREDGKTLTQFLAALVPAPADVERLVAHMHRTVVVAGDRLIELGDGADTLFFIESGQVSAYLESPGHGPVRLETMRGGRVVGELAFYLNIKRTAAVVVDEPGIVYSLSREQIDGIERCDPDAAKVFHQIMARQLADRVVHLMGTVNALLE
jgi:SulP family sulfate permease